MGDEKLLKAVFNPKMSDRREEGDRFVLPDNSAAYVQKLRSLVLEEDSVQVKRVEHFPSSWTSKLQMGGVTAVELHEKPEYLAEKSEVEAIKEKATMAFEKNTEDGTSFRIYRAGNLELRTTQAHDSEETVRAVFSVRA